MLISLFVLWIFGWSFFLAAFIEVGLSYFKYSPLNQKGNHHIFV
uniref:Uncharacterized protein n=1 Tax=Rhizophora mucronata TaxID=61149 RepID=A0A2P2QFX0_RHIMU